MQQLSESASGITRRIAAVESKTKMEPNIKIAAESDPEKDDELTPRGAEPTASAALHQQTEQEEVPASQKVTRASRQFEKEEVPLSQPFASWSHKEITPTQRPWRNKTEDEEEDQELPTQSADKKAKQRRENKAHDFVLAEIIALQEVTPQYHFSDENGPSSQ